MNSIIHREAVYLWYYFTIQFDQIFRYWVIGIVLGSIISVFGKDKIHTLFASMANSKLGILGVIPASLLGIASPLCMYGTIPIAASFSQKGMRDDWLAAFIMSSILLNPQLILYTLALGGKMLVIRIASCVLCGIIAGILVHFFFKEEKFFNFDEFGSLSNHDTASNIFIRILRNIGRNIKATGGYFLLGIVLSILFARYVPSDTFANLFGNHHGFGVLMAATVGIPLYVCGGGTIPLLMEWLDSGMSPGAAATFMITGPATKITNLGALKTVLGWRHFLIYILFIMVFAFAIGVLIV
ncbi:permease [Clostridium estertheticum]|uniref:permease n=1 Tax=Clostridium estertheticum TaxID=238834 RepID=UPI001C6E30D8|nr:permease [Clostridium estertheticum]MBW9173031.1 permease [Clostridium estertheticum]WLC76126.1 permease [Clostridium estertheticum]